MKILLAILLWAAPAWGMPFGQDLLGAAKYKNTAIQTLTNQGVGHFTNTFGDILPVIKAEAFRGVPFIRLHLMWKDAHNFSTKDFPAIVKEARRVCPVIKSNPQTKWYISGACEHNLNTTNARRLAHLVEEACPEATYVNTPGGNGAVIPEYINEIHNGGKPRSEKYAFSFDGTAAEDANIEAVKKSFPNAEYFMIWGPRYNGRWESNDSTPRPNRKGWPDSKYIKSLQYVAESKGGTELNKVHLWKSHSENKGTNDSRAEKPVFLTPIKANQVQLKRNGKVISTMPYYGTYPDGRYRYYAPKWGYEIGKVDIWISGKKRGSVNAGFRDATFK